VKYGYTINSSPAARCGHRPCFFPYTKSTNPIPLGMSDTNSHVGSNVMGHEQISVAPCTSQATTPIGRPWHGPRWSHIIS
jgi:hypothetical protein